MNTRKVIAIIADVVYCVLSLGIGLILCLAAVCIAGMGQPRNFSEYVTVFFLWAYPIVWFISVAVVVRRFSNNQKISWYPLIPIIYIPASVVAYLLSFALLFAYEFYTVS
jgi:hypothetical protein